MRLQTHINRTARYFESPPKLELADGALYLYGVTEEDRSSVATDLKQTRRSIRFIELKEVNAYEISAADSQFSLRNAEALVHWLRDFSTPFIYLDITGLSHSVWAVLVRALILSQIPSAVVYVEPGAYRFSTVGTDSEFFDLSERIEGIRPIPSFEAFSGGSRSRIFVPLLGFEGARFQHMLTHVDVESDFVRPLIGVPGFHLEFPSYTFLGNSLQLQQDGHWTRVAFARADCAFAAYDALRDISSTVDADTRILLGPIGTKPHALGAVLFHLCDEADSEIVYDHPLRKSKRTNGIGKIAVYDLSGLAVFTV